eukprot:854966-Rhodomonas_salina.2
MATLDSTRQRSIRQDNAPSTWQRSIRQDSARSTGQGNARWLRSRSLAVGHGTGTGPGRQKLLGELQSRRHVANNLRFA